MMLQPMYVDVCIHNLSAWIFVESAADKWFKDWIPYHEHHAAKLSKPNIDSFTVGSGTNPFFIHIECQ